MAKKAMNYGLKYRVWTQPFVERGLFTVSAGEDFKKVFVLSGKDLLNSNNYLLRLR
jgi:hypothetical protein